jgi:dihydropteroate synthase
MTPLLQPTIWRHFRLDWGEKTFVMAILNLTPDSFSGDGRAGDDEAAFSYAAAAEAAGADLLDVGGESTRPGHEPIDARTEIERVVPIIEGLVERISIPISIDTSKAAVAEAAIKAGATIVNDVRGFTRDPELAHVVARSDLPAVVMHDLPPAPGEELVASVMRELNRRIDRVLAAGVAWERIIIDPGFGFGKDWRQNLELLDRLQELKSLGRPVLVGMSRKKTIAKVLGDQVGDRLEGTLATTALAIARGADVVRVHDVLPNLRVARMTDAVIRHIPELSNDPVADQPA